MIDFSALVNSIKETANQFLDVVFPPSSSCPFCGSSSDISFSHPAWARASLCLQCLRRVQVSLDNTVTCIKCGKFIMVDAQSRAQAQLKCSDCLQKEPPFIRCWSVGPYEDLLREAIHRLKYQKERKLAKPLGIMMAEMLWNQMLQIKPNLTKANQIFDINPILVPIPLHVNKLYQRGFNQAQLLAEEISRETGYRTMLNLLLRSEDTSSQAGLGKSQREKNLMNKIILDGDGIKDLDEKVRKNQENNKINRKHKIVLVDDVYTTGATMTAAVGAIRAKYSEQELPIFAATICAGKQESCRV